MDFDKELESILKELENKEELIAKLNLISKAELIDTRTKN